MLFRSGLYWLDLEDEAEALAWAAREGRPLSKVDVSAAHDSAVLVLATMSTEEAGDPPLARRMVWGVAIALIAGVLLLAGGLTALQGMITIAALPFALLMLLVMWSLYRVLDMEYALQRRRAQRARRMMDAWIEREIAAQEETRDEAARAP